MSDYTAALKAMTLNELYKEFANTVDAMQGMASTIRPDDRTHNLSKLIIINNEIRERDRQNANKENSRTAVQGRRA